MPPTALAWPAEQCDGRSMVSNPQKCNILTQIDSNSARIFVYYIKIYTSQLMVHVALFGILCVDQNASEASQTVADDLHMSES